MNKKYFYITLVFTFFTFGAFSQDGLKIKDLNVYPNPVTQGRVFITSDTELPKEIEIFDVLGKSVYHLTTKTKELNVSSLSPGVYIIILKEGELSATRKLIIK